MEILAATNDYFRIIFLISLLVSHYFGHTLHLNLVFRPVGLSPVLHNQCVGGADVRKIQMRN